MAIKRIEIVIVLLAGAAFVISFLSGAGAASLVYYYFFMNQESGGSTSAATTSVIGTTSVVPTSPTADLCYRETTVTDRGTFVWPVTSTEDTSSLTCPHGPTGASATRLCRSNGVWDSAIITNCANPRITAGLTDLAETNITYSNVISVSHNLLSLVARATESAGDQNINNLLNVSTVLNNTASLLTKIATVAGELFAEDLIIIENTVQVLDGVQDWPPGIVGMQFNVIVQSFERIVNALISQENFTNLTIIQTDIAFQGLRIQRTDFMGITFVESSSNSSLSIKTVIEADHIQESDNTRIQIKESIANVTKKDYINIAFTLYNQSTLFPIREPPPDTTVGSSIISASVDGIPEGTILPENVTINFTIAEKNTTNHRCVFWDFSAAGGRGNWSVRGCTTIVINASYVTCICNHLTNFACLVDINTRTGTTTPTTPPSVRTALETVTIIGTVLSLIGLTLIIVTLLLLKKFRERDVSKFHIQLCLSLILMLIVFVVGIDRVSVRAGCITVGVLIHYFALVSWMWMGAEAVLMFQKLVIVFSNITWKYHLIVSIFCWALPLLPLVITVSIDPNFYIYSKSGDEHSFCFIGEMVPFLTAFLVPVFLILLFNLIIFVIIIIVVVRHNKEKNKRLGKSSMTTKEVLMMILPLTGIMLLFGLTWVFAVFTFISEPGVSYTVQFFFAFFSAFQGFFMFLFFVVFSSESRDAWKAFLCRNEEKSSSYKTSSVHNNKIHANHQNMNTSSVNRLASVNEARKSATASTAAVAAMHLM